MLNLESDNTLFTGSIVSNIKHQVIQQESIEIINLQEKIEQKFIKLTKKQLKATKSRLKELMELNNRVLNVLNNIDYVISNSNYTKNLAIELGVKEDKIIVINPGVDPVNEIPKKDLDEAEKLFNGKSNRLITVSRFDLIIIRI